MQVVEPDSAPPAVQKERPGGKKNAFYCVRFFPRGDLYVYLVVFTRRSLFSSTRSSWLVSKDISKLQKHEIEFYVNEPHKKPPRAGM